MSNQLGSYLAVIKVVGIGGGGTNAVTRMVEAGALGRRVRRRQHGRAGAPHDGGRREDPHRLAGDPRSRRRRRSAVGRAAAEESRDELKEALKGADMVFVTAGEGGGTGTGGAPVVAEIGRELGALTVGVVTRPFAFEGKLRADQAEQGIQSLRDSVDTLIVIENDRLLQVVERSTPVTEAFRMADDILRQGVQGITDLITVPGLINLDFADVRTIMRDAGSALMGIGVARGENRAVEAARRRSRRRSSRQSLDGATGILLNITGGPDLGLAEVDEAAEVVRAAADSNANVIFGAAIDEGMGEDVRVTAIATGFGGARATRRTEAPVGAVDASGERPAFNAPSVRDVELDIPSFLKED